MGYVLWARLLKDKTGRRGLWHWDTQVFLSRGLPCQHPWLCEIGLPLEVGNSYLGSGQISLISLFSEMRSQCIPAHLLPVALSEPSFTPIAHQKSQSTTCRLELCRLLPVRPHTPPTTHLQALAHGHRLWSSKETIFWWRELGEGASPPIRGCQYASCVRNSNDPRLLFHGTCLQEKQS